MLNVGNKNFKIVYCCQYPFIKKDPNQGLRPSWICIFICNPLKVYTRAWSNAHDFEMTDLFVLCINSQQHSFIHFAIVFSFPFFCSSFHIDISESVVLISSIVESKLQTMFLLSLNSLEVVLKRILLSDIALSCHFYIQVLSMRSNITIGAVNLSLGNISLNVCEWRSFNITVDEATKNLWRRMWD